MNKFLSGLALSLFFIPLAMPLPLFADDPGRGEGSGGATHDWQIKIETRSGSPALDHQKKSVLDYKNPGATKTFGYTNEGSVGASQVREAEKRILKHPSVNSSRPRHKVRKREGS